MPQGTRKLQRASAAGKLLRDGVYGCVIDGQRYDRLRRYGCIWNRRSRIFVVHRWCAWPQGKLPMRQQRR